jgi:signal transduction histidine kinase
VQAARPGQVDGDAKGESARTRAYVADVAHDLQNPLTGMRAQLEVAMAHATSEASRAWIRSMLSATTEMGLLVSDLLAIAAEEHPDLPAPDDLVDLDTLLRDEASRPRPETDVVIDVSDVTPHKVRGDEISLRRLVRNLLDNAVRHASSQVQIALEPSDGRLVLDVVDDGPGVPEEHRERIFERFYRADPQSGQGTGLGLSIVQQVAHRHLGTVAMLEGAPGEGAHFRVVLPIPD